MYRGRFAPSPTGPLHLGSLAAALASWLDARANAGTWLVRMEDIDEPRCDRATGTAILDTLARFGMVSDEPVVWQSERKPHYQDALNRLIAADLAYPCACTRSELATAPCNCRDGLPTGRRRRSWRFRSPGSIDDAILFRSDGYFSYQLAVVVDDHLQDITHIVRGDDLLETTPGQIALQRALGYSTPAYHHIQVIRDATGDKLSKQTRAEPIDSMPHDPSLSRALLHLGLPSGPVTGDWSQWAISAWHHNRGVTGEPPTE